MPPGTRALRFTAAAGSGLLLAASRPPLDLGPLACVALVPLFLAWRGERPRACAAYAFVAGVVYYGLLCSWIWYFGAIAIVPFVVALAAYWAGAAAVVAWFRGRGVSAPWLTAAIWVVADAAVARAPFGGLSWGEVGYAFHAIAPARVVASFGGVALVTFLAVACNALVADLLATRDVPSPALVRLRAGAGIGLVALLVVTMGLAHSSPPVTGTLRVALLQGNDKNRDLTSAELDARYLPESHFALAARVRTPVDLVVFPESSMDADPRRDPVLGDRLATIARHDHAWVLANATVDAPPAGKKVLNLDVLYAPDGTVVGTYAKRHLVPFGEYVPFRSLLEGWIGELQRVPRDFQPGSRMGLFQVAGVRIGTVICFESAFGYQVRPIVHAGAQVIVVSTNNRSYRRSANSAQHVAIDQMRAAETGRPVVHAAISGITAVIDADGTVHDRTKLFERTEVEATVAATGGQTPYVRYGEWVSWGSGLAVALLGAVVLLRRRRAMIAADSVDSASV